MNQPISYRECFERDLLHTADQIGVEWREPNWLSKVIISFQEKNRTYRNPDVAKSSHIMTVTEAKQGKPVLVSEMWPPEGRTVTLGPDGPYSGGCLLHIYRHQYYPPDDRIRVAETIKRLSRTHYSFIGVMRFLPMFKWMIPIRFHRFCSMLAEMGNEECGYDPVPMVKPSDVTPAMEIDSPFYKYQFTIDTDMR